MSKFVDQELFSMCAVTAIKISCSANEPISRAAKLIADEYGRSFDDGNLVSEIEYAANKIQGFLTDALPNASIDSACTQMQFCIKHFNLDGSKKRKRILGGVWFSGHRKELASKVDTCSANIITYHMLVIGGTIPIAPKGWSI